MAKIYTNENFRYSIVIKLRELGHDVLTALEAGKCQLTLSFHNRLSRSYLFKYFMVVWMICSHDSIPKIKI